MTQPLTADTFLADPCRSLTESQRTTFGLAKAKFVPDAGPIGHGNTGCSFASSDIAVIVELSFNRFGKGLDGLYSLNQSRDIWDLWEPFELDGYPAVVYNGTPGDPRGCRVGVGIADSVYFELWYTYRKDPGPDPCVAARNVASAALSTIKAGS